MHYRVAVLLAALSCAWTWPAKAQAPKQTEGTPVFKAESRLVVVDAVVTDKKGNHLGDLASTEFHVWEDNKEQAINSVTRESGESRSAPPTRLLLAFGRMETGDFAQAREAVARFAETNVTPDRPMALLQYDGRGIVTVAQSFTSDVDRLKQAVKVLKAADIGTPWDDAGAAGSDLIVRPKGMYTGTNYERLLLLAVQHVANSVASLPGRKILVYVGSALAYIAEEDNLAGAVAACNKANLAVYTFDVRRSRLGENALSALAAGTGGFSVENPNDARLGLERISRDYDEHYVLAYSPSKSPEDSCHTIKVKVDRPGALVRARTQYCNITPNDPLAGTPLDKELEARATGTHPGNIAAQMQSSFFYTAANTARVHLVADVPTVEMKFTKQNGKLHSTLQVLGIAHNSDGGVGARFSDEVNFEFADNKELEGFKQRPYRYEGQFEAAAGQYTLTLVLNSGDGFAKVQNPLVIEPYDAEHFAISGVALCRGSHPASETAGVEALLAANRVPLVSRGLQFTPSGSNRFRKTDALTLYLEVYEPLLHSSNPPKVQVQLLVVDRKSNTLKMNSGVMDMAARIQTGNPVVPVGLKVPLDTLVAGEYRIDLRATDSAGNISAVRSVEFRLD